VADPRDEAPQKVLIVDDEAANLEVLARAFEAMEERRYEILQTLSPRRALEIAVTEQPDLIITDWDMPELDGIGMIGSLKESVATRDILVIMCTGVMTTSENLKTALDAGAVDFIRKPVDTVELQARTRSMLQLASTLKRIRKQNEELRASYDRMEWMARTDMLTQLSNRRDFLEKLHREIAVSTRRGRSFVLALVDVDQLKAVNDRHGHQVGDEVLIALAGLLRRSLRPEDYVARWGGEEFILLFSDTDIEGGRVIAEKIRELVADRERFVEEAPVAITVTVGGCLFEGDGELGPLLRRADEVLHAAKAAGRDRVVIEA
jgi:diguanylate cyclase (GGDEF)-like protein